MKIRYNRQQAEKLGKGLAYFFALVTFLFIVYYVMKALLSFFRTIRGENSRLGGIPTLGESRMGRIPALGEGRHTKGHHRENMILTNLTHPSLGEARHAPWHRSSRSSPYASMRAGYATAARRARAAAARAAKAARQGPLGPPGVPRGPPGVPYGKPGVPRGPPGVPNRGPPGVPYGKPGVPRGPPSCNPNAGEIENPQYGQTNEPKCLGPCSNGPRNKRTGNCTRSGRANPGCTRDSIPGCANDPGLKGSRVDPE